MGGGVAGTVGGTGFAVVGFAVVGFAVVGFAVVGFTVVVGMTTGGRLDFVNVALNPLEVKVLSDLKRTTIVLLLDSNGFGIVLPQNFPVMG